MGDSASFNNFGGISSESAHLFGLIGFSLCRIKSSQTLISVTEGAAPVRSLCRGKLLLARPSLVPILAEIVY